MKKFTSLRPRKPLQLRSEERKSLSPQINSSVCNENITFTDSFDDDVDDHSVVSTCEDNKADKLEKAFQNLQLEKELVEKQKEGVIKDIARLHEEFHHEMKIEREECRKLFEEKNRELKNEVRKSMEDYDEQLKNWEEYKNLEIERIRADIEAWDQKKAKEEKELTRRSQQLDTEIEDFENSLRKCIEQKMTLTAEKLQLSDEREEFCRLKSEFEFETAKKSQNMKMEEEKAEAIFKQRDLKLQESYKNLVHSIRSVLSTFDTLLMKNTD